MIRTVIVSGRVTYVPDTISVGYVSVKVRKDDSGVILALIPSGGSNSAMDFEVKKYSGNRNRINSARLHARLCESIGDADRFEFKFVRESDGREEYSLVKDTETVNRSSNENDLSKLLSEQCKVVELYSAELKSTKQTIEGLQKKKLIIESKLLAAREMMRLTELAIEIKEAK